ncbi:MAG TPA: ADOP family duplicated permease [Gemmatimonadaceae bacterium]|nr:ADOP family duplicated permease [Gemmatimonadaceae bacterium]
MTPSRAHPPASAVWLLERFLPPDVRDAFLGDLEECFHGEVLRVRGARAARRWYWRETLRAPLRLARTPRASHAMPHIRGDGPMSSLLGDLRYALRLLARRPGFTALATLTLALGIGATTAIFSVVNPILFESLPYPHSERIMMVWERNKDGTKDNVGFATFYDIARISRSFEAAAAMGSWSPTITGRDEPALLRGQRVSPTYFQVLGVAPALGRDFRADEDVRGVPRVAILSHALWRGRFGGDSTLVGRTITLGGNPYTVVGVMPTGFENILDPTSQIWTLLRYDLTLPWACRTCHHLRMVAWLKPDVSARQAAGEMDVIAANLMHEHPTEYGGMGLLLPTLRDDSTSGVRPALLAVLGAVMLVLLIACANVTNLLLARGAQRQGEFAIRAALGAGRGRVIRQLLTESMALAVIGGVLGIGVAELGVRALVALSPAGLPRVDAIRVNGTALAFALAMTTLVGLVFGLVPAIHAARADLHRGIKQGTRRTAGSSHFTRASLVVSEVALALMLLVGSGLLLRSMERVFAVSPGFEPSGLLTMQVQAGGARLNNDTLVRAFFDRVLETVRTQPGVESVALTSQLPLSGDFDGYGVHSQTHPRANPEEDPSGFRYAVTPGYFATMRIPLVRGRLFTDGDRPDQPPVVIINESFVRRLLPTGDPIGQRVRVGAADTGPWREVVGIVKDVRQISLSAARSDAIYLPESQWQFADNAMSIVVRARGDAASLAPAIRRAVWSVDKDQPIVRIATMEELVGATGAARRFTLVLFEAFAAVALVLAAAGIYGVLAGVVTERLREIGVRSALGATRRDILLMVVRKGLSLTAIGVGVGLAAALAGSQALAGMLFGVSRADPLTYAGVTAVLLAVALVACWIPARRATRVDPVVTLRAE